jgi:hypothetical protein
VIRGLTSTDHRCNIDVSKLTSMLSLTEIRQKLRTAFWIALALAVVFSPQIAWKLQRPRTLDVVIVDKTVPFRKYREHAGIPWLLHAMKIRGSSGHFLDAASDYIGFDPGTRKGTDLTAEHLAHADALVITDTYGVYLGDYERPNEEAALERSPRIYGGLSETEANAIEAFAGRGGLVVGEFNTFASPTPLPARRTMERVFGVRWTRWVARYWPDLQDTSEVPKWVGRVWENINHTPFDMKGGGIVFVREDQDIEVLLDGDDLESRAVSQERTPRGEALGLPERGAFRFWMDVVDATDAEVLYEHVIGATMAGKFKLARHGLGDRFPALTKRDKSWYFAGDFVDTTIELGNPERLGIVRWRTLTSGFWSRTAPEDTFFWDLYAPVVTQLFAERAR